jgi:hypothetical protein
LGSGSSAASPIGSDGSTGAAAQVGVGHPDSPIINAQVEADRMHRRSPERRIGSTLIAW